MSDDEVLFSESLLEDEEQADEEAEEAEKYLDPDERLLAIIEGCVDGASSLDRMALTSGRIIFYTRGKGFLAAFQKTSAISVDYSQIVTVQGKKGTLLGEINLSTKDRIVRFKNMAEDDVDQMAGLISRMKDKSVSQAILAPSRESALEQLKKLAELRQMGAISEAEFQEKRKKLLEAI